MKCHAPVVCILVHSHYPILHKALAMRVPAVLYPFPKTGLQPPLLPSIFLHIVPTWALYCNTYCFDIIGRDIAFSAITVINYPPVTFLSQHHHQITLFETEIIRLSLRERKGGKIAAPMLHPYYVTLGNALNSSLPYTGIVNGHDLSLALSILYPEE